jgi:GNAT superfamily N-acetyltransferase
VCPEVEIETTVSGLHRVAPVQGPELRAFLAEHWPTTVKFLAQVDEEGADLGLWWADRWPQPGAVLSAGRRSFCFFAVNDESAARVLDGMDWGGEVRFSAMDGRFLPLIESRATVMSENPCGMFRLEPENFRPFRIEGVEIESLHPEDAKLISVYWPYGQDESYPLSRIQASPSMCIRLDGTPVAWALVHYDGSIGMVHTVDEHRRKGYARAVVSALVEERLRAGRASFCFIVEGNTASERLFEGLGFFRQADLSWILCAPKGYGEAPVEEGPRCDQ